MIKLHCPVFVKCIDAVHYSTDLTIGKVYLGFKQQEDNIYILSDSGAFIGVFPWRFVAV